MGEYKIHAYNSRHDDLNEMEALLSKVYSEDRYSFIKLIDSILPSGDYIAVLHYMDEGKTVTTPLESRVGDVGEL